MHASDTTMTTLYGDSWTHGYNEYHPRRHYL